MANPGLIKKISKQYHAHTLMVSGRVGPSSYSEGITSGWGMTPTDQVFRRVRGSSRQSQSPSGRVSATMRGSYIHEALEQTTIRGTFVETLDEALIKCEDDIISGYDLSSLFSLPSFGIKESAAERDELVAFLKEKFFDSADVLVSHGFSKREVYRKGDVLWKAGDEPSSAKILVGGNLFASPHSSREDRRRKSTIEIGEIVGLRTMLLDEKHSATLSCETACVFYTMRKSKFKKLKLDNPDAALVLMRYVAAELSRHVKHLSGVAGKGDLSL